MQGIPKPRRWRSYVLSAFLVPLAILLLLSVYHIDLLRQLSISYRDRPPIYIKCFPSTLPSLIPPRPRHDKVHPLLHNAFFDTYPRFHNTQRKCLQRFGPRPPCAKTLVWTCPLHDCAGAGDRMRGVQFAYMYAVVTKRVFMIDWSHPAALEAAMVPAVIDWTLPSFISQKLKKAPWTPDLDIPRLPWYRSMGNRTGLGGFRGTANISELMVDVVKADYDADKVTSNVSVDFLTDDVVTVAADERLLAIEERLFPRVEYFLHNPYIRKALFGDDSEYLRDEIANQTWELHFMQTLMQTIFRPSPKLEEELQRRRAQIGGPYDAVHARLGGDLREEVHDRFSDAFQHQNETAVALLQCLKKAQERNGGREAGRIYLATDSDEFKKVFVKAAKGIKVSTSGKRARHLAYDWPGEEEQVCNDYRDLFADAYMLGGGEVVVGSRSGFGDMAAGMGRGKAFVDTMLREEGRCVVDMETITFDADKIRAQGGGRR